MTAVFGEKKMANLWLSCSDKSSLVKYFENFTQCVQLQYTGQVSMWLIFISWFKGNAPDWTEKCIPIICGFHALASVSLLKILCYSILIGHKKMLVFFFQNGAKIPKFCIPVFERYVEFFFIQFWCSFSLDWLCWELKVIMYQLISSMA